MSWATFLSKVKDDPHHGFEQRINLLKLIQTAFKEFPTFLDMPLGNRKTIAGLPTDFHEHWGWFGSMKGAGYYHQAINSNNTHISLALDEIPLTGFVSREQYNRFISEFVEAFPKGGHGIGVASGVFAESFCPY